MGLAVTEEHNKDHEEEQTESSEADDEGEEERGNKPNRSQLKLWIAIGVGVVIAVMLVMKPGTSAQNSPQLPAAGTTTKGDLTLVSADRNELDCAAAKGFQNYQCGFSDEKQARQVEESQKLRPYMTVDRQLYLFPGLFLEPAISSRFNSEPPNKPRSELKRFTAKCTIKVIGELDAVKLRWAPDGAWEPAKKFAIATASDCKIEG